MHRPKAECVTMLDKSERRVMNNNFFNSLMVLIIGLFLIEASAPVANAAIIITDLPTAPASSSYSGIEMTIQAGGPIANEFSIGAPLAGSMGVGSPTAGDVGVYNWNTQYTFTLSNTVGSYGISLMDSANTVFSTSSSFQATTPYVDMVFAATATHNGGSGIYLTNLAIDGVTIPRNLAVGQVEPQYSQIFQVSGVGNSWYKITGTFTPIADITAAPSFNDFQFRISGLNAASSLVPEPSTNLLFIIGCLSLILLQKIMKRKQHQLAQKAS